MPYSTRVFDSDVVQLVRQLAPERVLDIGAGAGKWGQILRRMVGEIDAVEIHEPYVGRFQLRRFYGSVYIQDAADCDVSGYNLVILGDVLEHMTVADARALLDRCEAARVGVLVLVPFLLPQGASHGNEHERHLQPDLTHELFMERYPGFDTIKRNFRFGLYYRGAAK